MLNQQFCMVCGSRNDVDSIYCMNCGATLHGVPGRTVHDGATQRICANCGTCNQKNSTFCMECGSHLYNESSEDGVGDSGKSLSESVELPKSSHSSDMNDSVEGSLSISDAKLDIATGSDTASESAIDATSTVTPTYMSTLLDRQDMKSVYTILLTVGEIAYSLQQKLKDLGQQSKHMQKQRRYAIIGFSASLVCAITLLIMTRLFPLYSIIYVAVVVSACFICALIIGIVNVKNAVGAMNDSNSCDVYALREMQNTVDCFQNIAQTLMPLIPCSTLSVTSADAICQELSDSDDDVELVLARNSRERADYPFAYVGTRELANTDKIDMWHDTINRCGNSVKELQQNDTQSVFSSQRQHSRHRLIVFAWMSVVADVAMVIVTVIALFFAPLTRPVFRDEGAVPDDIYGTVLEDIWNACYERTIDSNDAISMATDSGTLYLTFDGSIDSKFGVDAYVADDLYDALQQYDKSANPLDVFSDFIDLAKTGTSVDTGLTNVQDTVSESYLIQDVEIVIQTEYLSVPYSVDLQAKDTGLGFADAKLLRNTKEGSLVVIKLTEGSTDTTYDQAVKSIDDVLEAMKGDDSSPDSELSDTGASQNSTQSDISGQTQDNTEAIVYPPYPGGISKDLYDKYVADMTTETEIQSAHTGMWQVMDCMTVGYSDVGLPANPQIPGGIRADMSEDFTHWIPNPAEGQYCVTRGGGSNGLGVQSFNTFVPLTREEIDMEPNAKAVMLQNKYRDGIGAEEL